MTRMPKRDITFTRLPEIALEELVEHMSDPRIAEHMPLLSSQWSCEEALRFVAAKEECWQRDGLGHWAFLRDGRYIGWGGFQKENDEWDFGLVLKPECFGLGPRITRMALNFAFADDRIPFVTILLPPSRISSGALKRLGAALVGEVRYEGDAFLKFRLETSGRSCSSVPRVQSISAD